MALLVTGAAGFIGSNYVAEARRAWPDLQVIGLDKLGYAGHRANLRDLETDSGFVLVEGNITDGDLVDELFVRYGIDGVVHLAAESHVDRSIASPLTFIESNVHGTAVLLEAARRHWSDRSDVRFHHVSTDEVFGVAPPGGFFSEVTPYDPRNPYAASKAAADHLVRAWRETYQIPVVVSNCTNNYGPYQFPEKLIPMTIINAVARASIPVYGDGSQVRDWLFVLDHCEALRLVFTDAGDGSTYCVGGESPVENRTLIPMVLDLVDEQLGRPVGESRALMTSVADRPGHDVRYAMDVSSIRRDLGWSPGTSLRGGLERTIEWYLSNSDWIAEVGSVDHETFQKSWYAMRQSK